MPETLPALLMYAVMSPILWKGSVPALFVFHVWQAAAAEVFPDGLDTEDPIFRPAQKPAGASMQSGAAPAMKDLTWEASNVEDKGQFRWLRGTYFRSVWPI